MKTQGKAQGLLLVLATALIVPVANAAVVRHFEASIDPDTANGGQTQPYTITVTNDSGTTATQEIGYVTILVPSDFALISGPVVSSESDEAWNATFDSTTRLITLTPQSEQAGQKKLAPGESVIVELTATAPNPETVTTYTWWTYAWKSEGDGSFTLMSSQPTVTVTPTLDFVFAGWRPPVIEHLDDEGWAGWKSGSTMPVKFLVVDEDGNPVIEGVEVMVQIGDSDPVAAELDDAAIGQWIAEIVLVGDGEQEVTITGNVDMDDVDPLIILVKP